MNVLFIHNTFPEYRINFFNRLSMKENVHFLFTDIELTSKIYGFENNNIYKENIDYYLWKNINYLKTLIINLNVDVIILPPCDSLRLYFISKKVINIAKKYKIKLIYWNERWEFKGIYKISLKKKTINKFHSMMIMNLCKKSDRCIASGTKSLEYLISLGILKEKIKIAYDSSSSTMDNYKKNDVVEKLLSKNKFIVLFLGRMIPRKGCDLLIKAFNLFSAKHNDVALLIGGSGEKNYVNECKKLSNSKTYFIGPIKTNDRFYYYLKSSVFVLPSISINGVVEAWGLTINESLECGTPVIASNVVGAAYDLIDDNVGRIVKEGSISALVNALEEIYSNNIDYSYDCKMKYNKYSVENMAYNFSLIIEGLFE